MAVSCFVTLVLLEALIRAGAIPLPPHISSSGWWKEAWLRGHPGPVPQRFVQLDPDLGWIPAPNLEGYELQGARIGTNSASLRGRREYPRERSEAPRVVAVGDSYTFGQCADDEHTWPAQLEALLPRSEVLNLGVMGYGHDQALRRLELHGLGYSPDVVLLGFVMMDVPRNRLFFRDYGKPRYLLEDGRLVLDEAHLPVKTPQEYLSEWRPRFENYWLMLRDGRSKRRNTRTERELALAIVREMRQRAEAAGARFALVYLPREKDLHRAEDLPTHLVAGLCEDAGLWCISPLPRIRRAIAGTPDAPHFDCHYSAEVYGLVAEEVAAALSAQLPALFGRRPD